MAEDTKRNEHRGDEKTKGVKPKNKPEPRAPAISCTAHKRKSVKMLVASISKRNNQGKPTEILKFQTLLFLLKKGTLKYMLSTLLPRVLKGERISYP